MPESTPYFRLRFHEHPAEEGDGWQGVGIDFPACGVCGRRSLPFASRFVVPDDRVIHADAGFWGLVDHALVYCSGILLAREDVATALFRSALTGFELRPATVSRLDDEPHDDHASPYRWVVITGRCDTTPVWRRVVNTCGACGFALTEPANNPTRIPQLLVTYPHGVDLCRGREDDAGIIVSARFRSFLERHDAHVPTILSFEAIEFTAGAAGAV